VLVWEDGRVRRPIDLNADVGEGFDSDTELFGLITSANVACGFHAGDAATMRASCELAAAHGVCVGAQVSYRDREGFGRRELDVDASTLRADIEEQLTGLAREAAAAGLSVGYLKPHGALYNRVVRDDGHAAVVVEAARAWDLPVLGLPRSRVLELAAAAGVGAFREFFADRGYASDGKLVPRTETGALVADPAEVARRVARMAADGVVGSVDGVDVPVAADSVCVHGDTPGAVGLARGVRAALLSAGRDLRPFA
jgi:UPF0271 protein